MQAASGNLSRRGRKVESQSLPAVIDAVLDSL
jgi:hypothetical protein